jgi:hypothetical protein
MKSVSRWFHYTGNLRNPKTFGETICISRVHNIVLATLRLEVNTMHRHSISFTPLSLSLSLSLFLINPLIAVRPYLDDNHKSSTGLASEETWVNTDGLCINIRVFVSYKLRGRQNNWNRNEQKYLTLCIYFYLQH